MKLYDISVKADFGFFAIAAVMLYFGGEAAAFFAAVLLHEAGHLAAMFLLSKCSAEIKLTAAGVYINPAYRYPISKLSEALILISGPLFGVVSGILLKDMLYGLFKACVALSVINLIPIRGTDGGSLLELICEKRYITIKPIAQTAAFGLAAALTLFPYLKGEAIEPIWMAAVALMYLRGKEQK